MIIGSSGQPLEDITKAAGSKDISPIEWLEKTIIWRHMCPTAPDTLPAYPFYKKDLFIMKDCPDIYFTGNADKYETKLWKGIYYLFFFFTFLLKTKTINYPFIYRRAESSD